MLRIGLAGIGFMGMIHYLVARRLRGAEFTAVCSRDPRKLAGDWRSIRGNFGPPGHMVDLSHLNKYDRLEAMLADPELDLIDICMPTHRHASAAMAALQAGKHVLVEKPIALQPTEAEGMLEEAARSGKMLMVGQVLPFFPEFAFAAETIRDGKHGRLVGAHFKRIISRPDWSAGIGDASQTGGPAVDLHIHDAHFIALVCGLPDRVFASGVIENGVVQYLTTQYLYPAQRPCVSCASGAIAMKAREFVHGYEIYLDKATVVYESGTTPLTVLHADGHAEKPEHSSGGDPLEAFAAELQAAIESITTGRAHNYLSAELARHALVLCHKECESVKTGKAVEILGSYS